MTVKIRTKSYAKRVSECINLYMQALSQNWCSLSLDWLVTPSIGIPTKRIYSVVHYLSKARYMLFAKNDKTPMKWWKVNETRIVCRLLFVVSVNLFFVAVPLVRRFFDETQKKYSSIRKINFAIYKLNNFHLNEWQINE